ncbi:MAG: hypothetical protein QW057_09880 [Candidatus Bathyarchaeia archaeon]
MAPLTSSRKASQHIKSSQLSIATSSEKLFRQFEQLQEHYMHMAKPSQLGRGRVMVFCTRRGAKNPGGDDAALCVQCGASLTGASRDYTHRRGKGVCLGGTSSGAGWVFCIFFGLLLLLGGLTSLLSTLTGVRIEFWPIFLILLSAIIIIGTLTGRRRR